PATHSRISREAVPSFSSGPSRMTRGQRRGQNVLLFAQLQARRSCRPLIQRAEPTSPCRQTCGRSPGTPPASDYTPGAICRQDFIGCYSTGEGQPRIDLGSLLPPSHGRTPTALNGL